MTSRRGPHRFSQLAAIVAKERERLCNLGFLRRPVTVAGSSGELHVMRRWNSFTPLTSQTVDSIGGAYVLLWRGGVTVVDPGYGFMKMYAKLFSMLDLNCVIVTHDHPDHCEDLLKILTLLRELNELRSQSGEAPHKVRLLLSYGAYFKASVLLQNEQIAPYVTVVKVLAPLDLDFRSELGFTFQATTCQHREILGDSTTFGVRINLYEARKRCCIGITSDTGYRPDIASQFDCTDLLMLHIGAMEEPHSTGLLSSHLGTRGVRRFLKALERLPRVSVITEWGEEFYGQRAAVCEFVGFGFPGHVVLPGDALMRIRLPSCQVSLFPEHGYLPPEQIVAYDDGSNILYTRRR